MVVGVGVVDFVVDLGDGDGLFKSCLRTKFLRTNFESNDFATYLCIIHMIKRAQEERTAVHKFITWYKF